MSTLLLKVTSFSKTAGDIFIMGSDEILFIQRFIWSSSFSIIVQINSLSMLMISIPITLSASIVTVKIYDSRAVVGDVVSSLSMVNFFVDDGYYPSLCVLFYILLDKHIGLNNLV